MYEPIIESAYPPHLWDSGKLQILAGLLDSTTQLELQAKREANHHLAFSDYWESLELEFGRDSAHQSKAAWKNVRLHSNGKKLTEK